MRAEWRFRSTDFQGLRAARGSALELLRKEAAPSSDIDACAVVLSELMANATQHAPAGSIHVALEWTEATPLFTVTDSGTGFEPRIALPPASSEGGRGLFLVEQLAATPTVTIDERGCTVAVRLPLARQA
jgi:anti-sigma regulatory factor (Ser/Thr protein kinase)